MGIFSMLVMVSARVIAIPVGLYLGAKFMNSSFFTSILETRQNTITKALKDL